MSNRLNFVGAISVICIFIGATWYSADGDTETGIEVFLWIGAAFGTLQYFWNLFAFGEPAMGTELRKSNSLLAGGAGAADDGKVAQLEAENADLRRRAAGADEKLQEENAALADQLRLEQSRLGALKTEIAGAEERFVEREHAFKQNISDLQKEIGELNKDAETRTKVVADARTNLEELKPYIGIMIEDIPKKEKAAKGLVGVRIQTVKPDTPAASVGFEAGDVIERMNSKDMASSEDVMKNLRSRKPGDICSFIVNRGGTFENIVMEVGHKDMDADSVHKLRRLASGLIQADDLQEA